MPKLQSFLLIALAVIGLVLFAAGRFLSPAAITLSELKWEKPPGFVAIGNATREGKSGLLFTRLKDGKEQFIGGDWRVVYSESGAYAFGSFPEGKSESAGQQIYYLSGDGRIYHISLKDPALVIEDVKENPGATYLFISIIRDRGRSFCVIPRLNEDKPDCQQLDVGNVTTGLWNPDKERELVLRTDKQQIFTYDPWEKKPNLLDPAGDEYAILQRLFTEPAASLAQKPVTLRLFNLLLVKQEGRWAAVRVPLTAKIGWLHDWKHLLAADRNGLSVVEPFNKRAAPLLKEKDANKRPVFFRSNGFDGKL